MYQTILFDLDGTLTNSELGITNSVAYALGKYGIQVPDKKALRVFIGPPLQESFERFYGFSKEECLKAIDYYHEYFSEKGLYENEVYLGVPDLLASLKQAGKQLIVATSKPEDFPFKFSNTLVCMIILTLSLVRPWIENVVKKAMLSSMPWSKMGLQIWRIPS